ncbi:hypothetical protein [Kitasatospora sp. NPDC057223]|uniref:hypothetical protein n=1 Tax=Kitasatospora sp. NPDC057223 TaxID=3346055 RepID=UPI003633105D
MNQPTIIQPVTAPAGAIAWGQDMLSGEIRPYYSDQPAPPTLAPIQAPSPPAVVQRDVWPARLLAGGAGASMVIGVTGSVAPQLEQVGHAVQMAGFGIGAVLAGLAFLKGNAPKLTATFNISNTGSSSSANATSNSTSSLFGRSGA